MKKKPRGITLIRKRAEVLNMNHRFMDQLRRGKEIANLRVEQQRLQSLLSGQLMPGLREKIKTRLGTVDDMMK